MASDNKRTTERLFEGTVLQIKEAHLVVVDGAQAGLEVPCGTRAVRIGSASTNELVLPDSAASAEHAVLEFTPAGLALRDLESTNGTFVDGMRIREVFVQPGSALRIGRTTLRVELRARRDEIPPSPKTSFGRLVGRSLRMRQLFGLLEWVAPTEASLLITGPSGSGKEMVARSVHEASPRSGGPFQVLDCGAIDASLISSELFGHEPGAFTFERPAGRGGSGLAKPTAAIATWIAVLMSLSYNQNWE